MQMNNRQAGKMTKDAQNKLLRPEAQVKDKS